MMKEKVKPLSEEEIDEMNQTLKKMHDAGQDGIYYTIEEVQRIVGTLALYQFLTEAVRKANSLGITPYEVSKMMQKEKDDKSD
jgi:transcriptional regulator with AAA-type ATPase domain